MALSVCCIEVSRHGSSALLSPGGYSAGAANSMRLPHSPVDRRDRMASQRCRTQYAYGIGKGAVSPFASSVTGDL